VSSRVHFRSAKPPFPHHLIISYLSGARTDDGCEGHTVRKGSRLCVLDGGERDLPEDTSGTNGRGRKSKHLGLSSPKPDISSFLGVVLERSGKFG
jgi:hypothetical protein